jgi:predicted ATPase
MTIKIERYEVPKVNIFKTDGEFVGVINNEHEFNKVRIQMLKEKVTNEYYFMWEELKITVYEDGSMSDFPVGLYDQVRIDLFEIFKIVEKNKKERE